MDAQKERPLTVDEAADLLNIAKSTLYKLTAAGEIPHCKPFGKKIYFFREDLNSFIRSKRVRSKKEIDREAALHGQSFR